MTTQQPDALIPDEKTVMAQAQVYASTWAIVGSRFDAGDGLELAEQEKTILADMVRRLGARITELESQLEQRFDAADVATAAAQGFRDGVASVSAGSEPVASCAIRILVAADFITQAKADEALRLAAEITSPPALLMERAMSDTTTSKGQALTPAIGGLYNWKGQPERLVYMGTRRYLGDLLLWHQFAKVETPEVCWSEVLTPELAMFEETKGTK